MTKLVFLTGASSGIGQALAVRFYQAGYRLALVARQPFDLLAWASAAGWQVGRFRVYCAEVAVIDSIVGAANKVTSGYCCKASKTRSVLKLSSIT